MGVLAKPAKCTFVGGNVNGLVGGFLLHQAYQHCGEGFII